MDSIDFQIKIEKELKKLDKNQIVEFAWRCAVRALPILGANGNFDFWKVENRKKYIHNIFYAIDITAANASNNQMAPDINFASAREADVASSLVNRGANAAKYISSKAISSNASIAVKVLAPYARVATLVSKTVSKTAEAAAYADRVSRAFNSDRATAYIADSARVAASAANFAIYAAQAYGSNNIFKTFESYILNDIYYIKEGREFSNPIATYGKAWTNFLRALEKENCAYWGRLYQDIFENGFKIDREALERRLNVPKEIKKQGAAAVANYLEELEKGAKKLNEARIIILGDKGSGKTSIARKLIDIDAPMPTENESTAGVDKSVWELKEENIDVHIWDFAGHVVTHAVHQFFLSERCLYIIVYNGRTEEKNKLEYWLNHMKNYGGNSEAMILVNKKDRHRQEIPINTLKEQYSIVDLYEFSIKDNRTKLAEFRKKVAEYISNKPSWNKLEIPTSYYEVKEKLENLFNKNTGSGREYISREEFNDIAKTCENKENDELLKNLNNLGISLWYENMAKYNMLILNPEWISHGVYAIINWVTEEKKHNITFGEFEKVFKEKGERYPKVKHQFLYDLMRHYELAYECEIREGKELIIPHLLKIDRPKKLPEFSIGESLMLRYKSEQPLPPNTISRFIVRHNLEIKTVNKQHLVWRYGVVLESNNCIALVREEDRTISVSVKGNDRTNYLSKLRDTLNDIFESYKSDKPELQYRVERFGKIPDIVEEKNPIWLPDRKIKNHVNNNVPYYDDELGQNIPLERTVNIYNIDKVGDHAIIGGRGHNVVNNITTFKDCNIGIQGNLNELSDLFVQAGHKAEAKELQEAAKALEKAEQSNSKEEIKKKGLVNKVRRFLEDLEDENSKFHKTVKGIKNGISIAQDIAKGYNDIAQWAGLPQVPKPFL